MRSGMGGGVRVVVAFHLIGMLSLIVNAYLLPPSFPAPTAVQVGPGSACGSEAFQQFGPSAVTRNVVETCEHIADSQS